MPMKNPLIPAGIEPATYRFVAQQDAKVESKKYYIPQINYPCLLHHHYEN